LAKDSTFSYSINGDLINSNSKGEWEINANNQIILNSDSLYRTGIIHVAEKHDSTLDAGSYSIHVFDEEKIPFASSVVIFDQDTLKHCIIDDLGFCSISLDGFTTFSIFHLSEEYQYQRKDLETNVFEITIKLDELSTFYIENDVWRYKRGRIVNPNNLVFKKESN